MPKPVTKTETTNGAPKSEQGKKGEQSKHSGRKIKYDDIRVCGIPIPRDKRIVTVQTAMDLLGWVSESDHEKELTKDLPPEKAALMNTKFGTDYFLTDINGEKVRLTNNVRNRPYNDAWARTLAQDILNENWEFNGESWVVGETGLTLSLQHRAIALVFAEQMRLRDDADGEHWRKRHPDPLTIEALIVTGISESPKVTRTLDNVRPRTLMDVLFADTTQFNRYKPADRQKLCNMADYAIRTVWHRTGCRRDAFAPMRTHSESIEFITLHPHIVQAVKFIFTEVNSKKDAEGKLTNQLAEYIALGTAAGLMFLMGSSNSDRERWWKVDAPNDRLLNFDRWDMAQEFWAGVGNKENDDFNGVRGAIEELGNVNTGAPATPAMKAAVMVNAWNEFVEAAPKDRAKAMTKKRVWPEFGEVGSNGKRGLAGTPTVGGIDIGDPREQEAREKEAAAAAKAAEGGTEEEELVDGEEGEENEMGTAPAAEAEVEERIKAARAAKEAEAKAPAKSKTVSKKPALRGGTNK